MASTSASTGREARKSATLDRKFRQTGIAHERLESDDAPLSHLGHVANRAWNKAAPHAEVGNRRLFERLSLAIDFACIHGAGSGVQRHVEEHRAAAGRERAASSRRAFPLGATWFVEVHMNVDGAGKDEEPACFDFLGVAAGHLWSQLDDTPVFDQTGRRVVVVGGDSENPCGH